MQFKVECVCQFLMNCLPYSLGEKLYSRTVSLNIHLKSFLALIHLAGKIECRIANGITPVHAQRSKEFYNLSDSEPKISNLDCITTTPCWVAWRGKKSQLLSKEV